MFILNTYFLVVMNFRTRSVVWAIAAFTTLFPIKAKADDFARGIRGPTRWQVDERISYSKNEKGLETVVNDNILKYWDGNNIGKFAALMIPYKKFDDKRGFGDITFLLGPRATIKNFHLIQYNGLTFPTGNYKNNIGNGRYDAKLGLMYSYVPSLLEFHSVIQYTFTGKNKQGINPSNEFYYGTIAGRNIANKIKLGAGATFLYKTNKDYLTNLRTVMRYTISKRLFFEFLYDKSIDNKNIVKSNRIEFQARYNFGNINNK